MGGNGGDNAHNNAFGGGKNPGLGNSGTGSNSGSTSGAGNGGHFSGDNYHYQPGKGPNSTTGPDGQVHVNITGGMEKGPDQDHKGNGGSGGSGGGSGSRPGDNNINNPSGGNGLGGAPTTWDRTANYYNGSDKISRKALQNMYEEAVRTGSIPGKARGTLRDNVQKMLDEDKKIADEKEALTKASELIADMGEKIGAHLGDKYKAVAKEIAEDIKNFQGRTLRNYEQTMASLKKILDNPNMKINKGDKDAIVNAWRSFKADDTAKKLSNLSKAFHAADVALKIEKVREKSIEGYETGNWGPLVLEVESWVLSGVAVGVAIGILADIAPVIALTFSLPVSAVTIVGIIGIGFISSKLDDKFADWINNELIRPAN